jgi:3-hydroxyacyl-[acyl-carrier-protein] dehydratase
MLRNSFFYILAENHAPGSIKSVLSVNKDHPIFNGHFPNQPIVPGVCMLQIIKELVEGQTKRILRYAEAENIKFLSIIDPLVNNTIEATVTYTEDQEFLTLNAALFSGQITFFKLKAMLQNA